MKKLLGLLLGLLLLSGCASIRDDALPVVPDGEAPEAEGALQLPGGAAANLLLGGRISRSEAGAYALTDGAVLLFAGEQSRVEIAGFGVEGGLQALGESLFFLGEGGLWRMLDGEIGLYLACDGAQALPGGVLWWRGGALYWQPSGGEAEPLEAPEGVRAAVCAEGVVFVLCQSSLSRRALDGGVWAEVSADVSAFSVSGGALAWLSAAGTRLSRADGGGAAAVIAEGTFGGGLFLAEDGTVVAAQEKDGKMRFASYPPEGGVSWSEPGCELLGGGGGLLYMRQEGLLYACGQTFGDRVVLLEGEP